MPHDAATLRQIAAARPDRSTWLSANAGSGKTKVLTDRVARLLLDGVNPQHILCLTYTKAAASEMQNRLFKRLGAWAMLPDDVLAEQLLALGHGNVISKETLNDARRLFASAIETPGGLKIQTIHSFCSALLRRFPFEAGVTPNFSEMEERASALLRAEIIEEIASGPDRDALYAVAQYISRDALERLAEDVIRMRTQFASPIDDKKLRRLLGLSDGVDEQNLAERVFSGAEAELLRKISAALMNSGPADAKAAKKLRDLSAFDVRALPILEDIFLFGPGAKTPFLAKIGAFPTKSCRVALQDLMSDLEALMQRVEQARPLRLGLMAFHKTKVLYGFARVFITAYENAKQVRGWLDFDDLILRARDLLTNQQVADWVLYKLDGDIDHILVDEAQDTSPAQWQVIECLAREFVSGEGAKPDRARTLFVVGDKKQSIYSFQGADPREFDRMKADFASRLKNTTTPLQDLEMDYSFRSAGAVLQLVDKVFEGHQTSGFTPDQLHISFKDQLPGRVDLWPVVERPDRLEEPAWYDPVDIKAPDDPGLVLARRVAAFIDETIGQPIPDETGRVARRIKPGDFLVLVRRRSAVFHDIIRECKARGLPVAGADRLKVGAELAVKDLGALLSSLATPEDDLALATALRSPLFGWSEAQLFDLAHDRKQLYLSAELRDRAAEFPETMAILNDLRDQTDYLRPYDLIDRILIRHNGRRKLLARLGVEAEDGIDALLSQALAYERNAVDSLTGFLVWMEVDDLEIKRQLDTAGNQIRVMTVHGAKGLEAPIVILPDTAKWQQRTSGDLLEVDDAVIWRAPSGEATALQIALDEETRAAQQAERDRLLYVAMTRAEQWLVVAAAGDLGRDGQSWHDKVRIGLEQLGASQAPMTIGEGLRLENGNWMDLEVLDASTEDRVPPKLPAMFQTAATRASAVPPTLSPSDLGGPKALPDEQGLDEDAAKRRGRQIHRLLEVLPATRTEDWSVVTNRILSSGEDMADENEQETLLIEARGVLEHPDLADLFLPDALAEVPISAEIELLANHRIHGVIDRLLVSDDRVLAVDFKTNIAVPERASDCPEGLLRQMGAYAHALMQIYPDRPVQTALLWTRTATLMHLPHDLVTDALRSTYIP